LLIDVIFLTLTGRRASTASISNDKEEMRKVITTLAISGDEMVSFDNLSHYVGNDTINRALTTCDWHDRILGGNREFNGPLLTVWYGTGNNPMFQRETARRVLRIYLESHEERPQNRSDFKRPNLRDHVLAHRSELLSAALTVMKAYFTAGCPKQQLNAWGSFESWSALVRGAVVYAGLPDSYGGAEDPLAVPDEEDVAFATLLLGLLELDRVQKRNGQGFTVKELLEPTLVYHCNAHVKAIPGAVESLAPLFRNETNRAPALGAKLKFLANRVMNGIQLQHKGRTMHGVLWAAKRLSSNSAHDADDANDAIQAGAVQETAHTTTNKQQLPEELTDMCEDPNQRHQRHATTDEQSSPGENSPVGPRPNERHPRHQRHGLSQSNQEPQPCGIFSEEDLPGLLEVLARYGIVSSD
jgi:hypothetical protein